MNMMTDAIEQRRNVVYARNVGKGSKNKKILIDEGDYNIAKALNEKYLAESNEDLFSLIKVREEDSQKRIFSLRQSLGWDSNILQLDALERLELRYLAGHVPKCIGKMKKLKYLEIDVRTPQTLPEELGALSNLEELSLPPRHWVTLGEWVNQTKTPTLSFPSSLGSLPNQYKSLKILKWACCEVPSFIGQLKQLEVLDLSFSQLDSLPKEIGYLVNLEVLTIKWASIKALPQDIRKLQNLRELDLSFTTALENIPSEIGSLKRLEKLFLSCKAAKTADLIPASIFNLNRLSAIHLDHGFDRGGEANERWLKEIANRCPYLFDIKFRNHHSNGLWNDEYAVKEPQLQHRLMCNRINRRLLHPNEFGTWLPDYLQIPTNVGLWPKILEQLHRSKGKCGIRYNQREDALYYLLVTYGAMIFEAAVIGPPPRKRIRLEGEDRE